MGKSSVISTESLARQIGVWPANAVIRAIEDAEILLPHVEEYLPLGGSCTEAQKLRLLASIVIGLDWFRFMEWHLECMGILQGPQGSREEDTNWDQRRQELACAVQYLLGEGNYLWFQLLSNGNDSSLELVFSIGANPRVLADSLRIPSHAVTAPATRWLILPQDAARLARLIAAHQHGEWQSDNVFVRAYCGSNAVDASVHAFCAKIEESMSAQAA